MSITKCKGTDSVDVAESALLTMKGHIFWSLNSLNMVMFLDALLSEKESNSHVVMVYLYLSNMQDYTAVNEVYAKSFTSHYPARFVVSLIIS